MRWTVLLPLIFILPLTARAFATEVRIGIDNNPPLTFIDAAGRADGLLPNLLQQMADENRWTLTVVPCRRQQCLEKLENGQIDILPAVAYTEERAKIYRFAEETVFNSWGQVYQRPGGNYASILQLEGKKLAVLPGDIYFTGTQGLLQVARNFGVNINFVEVPSYEEAFAKLARGEVDAAMVGRAFGITQRQKFNLLPSSIMIKPVQVRPAFSPFAPAGIKVQFDRSLASWQQTTDSTYYQLLEEWLGEELPRRIPTWVKAVIYALVAFLCLLLPATIWTRRQVKRQTRQLAEKNRQLEDELIERQRVESELRERQQQYHVLFEETQAIMLLIDPKTAEIVDANPAACSFYRYPRETMQGMKIGQLNGLSEEKIQTTIDQIEARQLQKFELVHRLADGEERQVEIQSSPIIVNGRSLICSIVCDINERKIAERKIEERNTFLQSVIDGVSDPLMVIGFDFRILQMNRVAREQAGLSLSSPGDLSCHQLSHASAVPCDGEDHPCPISQVQETGQPVTVIHNHLKNQQQRIVELNVSPLYNTDGSLRAVIEVSRDITERQQAERLLSENEKRLQHLAHHDSLTDLPNRLLFEDRLKQALSKAPRSRKQVALFFLDLDHFKDVNDNLGHDFGDLLLIDVAGRLRSCVREGDTVARMGGDEFLVLLEEVETIEMVETMAERICNALIHELRHDNYQQQVSASIGISLYPEDGINGQELLRKADQAMYQAKSKGKANYQFASAPQGHLNFD